MFDKVHGVITNGNYSSKAEHGKLRPIHCLDICNLIGQNVVVGGVRRTAEIAIIDPSDPECVHAKDNITQELSHRYMSNNSIYQEEKPSRERIHELFESIRTSGEPGIINVKAAQKRREDFAGVNPCTSPDTEILTKEYGNVAIVDVVDREVTVWNGYEWSVVTPRVTGHNQPMLKITFNTGSELKCTDYHTFVLCDNSRVKAIELSIDDKLQHFTIPEDGNENNVTTYTNVYVTGIERIANCPTVYCFTEPKNHTGIFNGIMTGQCGEVLLPPNAVCNLTTVNMTAFVDDYGNVDFEALEEAFILSARAGYRMTCVDLELDGWDEVHHRDRLTGCSMTGWQDFMSKVRLGLKPEENEEAWKKRTLMWLNDVVSSTGKTIARELGTPVPLLMTSVKPEGSLSLVANGVSPGVHWQHSPYFIRRIRVNAHDPLALTAKELGWQIHPEVGQDMETATTIVIDFPVYSPATVTKADIPAVEQLKEYILFQENYTDMNTSNTITVKPGEWKEVEDFVYEHWDDILGVTFLELNSTYYPLMPYEECTKEEYEALKSKMKPFDPHLLNELELSTRNMGKEFEILDDRAECVAGVCPIR